MVGVTRYVARSGRAAEYTSQTDPEMTAAVTSKTTGNSNLDKLFTRRVDLAMAKNSFDCKVPGAAFEMDESLREKAFGLDLVNVTICAGFAGRVFLPMKSVAFFTLALVLLASQSFFAQYQKVVSSSEKTQIFPLSELKEGMRGTARSVFRGSKSEEFNVEILGVLPNSIGPKQDMIVGRLSGANAERTFVFAGMSGSPVYIDGRLVGAIAYSFPFAKEPMCGITPFEQMSSLVERTPMVASADASPRSFSYRELLSEKWQPTLGVNSRELLASGFAADSRLMAVAGQAFKPIATPVTFSGVSQKTLDAFSQYFSQAGILPVAAAGSNATIAPLKPYNENTLLGGDSVVVHLARGDIEIGGFGTVTLRDGEKIYAFGHPFFSLGATSLPMSESHVVTVVPNANNSFKLAVADALVGTMTQDRATGIYGSLGASPRMLPIKVKFTNSRGRAEEMNFESAFDELLTPLIVTVGVTNAVVAQERNVGDTTIEVKGEIAVRGEQPITINRRFAGNQAVNFASSSAAVPLAALLRSNFDGLDIAGVTLNIRVIDGSKTAVLDRISVDKTQVRAGETIEVSIFERTESGKLIERKTPLTIPASLSAGALTITVGDGNAVQQNSAVTQFTPRSAAELIATINRLKRPDRLYAVLTRSTNGAVVGASEMPNLPPSMLATINNERTAGGAKPTIVTTIFETELASLEYIVTGSQTLTVEIVK